MPNYRESFTALLIEIKSNNKIEVVSATKDIPITDEKSAFQALKLLEKSVKKPISKYFLDFFDISRNTSIHWIAKDSSVAGEFSLSGIRHMFSETDLSIEEMDENDRNFLKHVGIVDGFPSSGMNKSTIINLNESEFPPRLYFYDRGEYFMMTVDYAEYIDTLLLTKGMTDWQYLFCKLDSNYEPMGMDYRGLIKSINALEKLFPDDDYTELYKRQKYLGKCFTR